MGRLIKTPEEIRRIKTSGCILARVLKEVCAKVAPGVRLSELDAYAERLIREAGAKPSFLGYQPEGAAYPYPNAICASVGSTVVHGIPGDRVLEEGDIVSIDIGVNWQGGFSDAARTVPVGTVKKDALKLIEAAESALFMGIHAAHPGNTLGDIGHAIEREAARNHAHVLKGLTGHGVGLDVHEDPVIFNYGRPGDGMVLKEGMVLALEPMVSFNTSKVIQKPDDSYATADGSLAAHAENTIVITKNGPLVVTSDECATM